MSELNRDDFAAQQGTKFEFFFDEESPFEAELIEVTELRRTPVQESFSIVFLAPADAPAIPGLVKMRHETLGSLDLSISPFAQDEKGTKFEAVFNRLLVK